LQEYKFQVQVPAKGDETKLITVGKADLDLSFFVLSLGQPQSKLVPIMFKVGAASTGYLKLVITAEAAAGDIDEDGMTEVSGMTGVVHTNEEQDLSGVYQGGGRSLRVAMAEVPLMTGTPNNCAVCSYTNSYSAAFSCLIFNHWLCVYLFSLTP
jgi:hypothetical protein